MNKAVTFPRCAGRVAIDPVTRKLEGPSGTTFVEPLVMRLLVFLLDRQGEVVPRRELFSALWGNAQVGDDSLNRLIVRLREALRLSAGGEVLVETVPRVGYRLLVEDGQATSPPMRRRTLITAGASAAAVLLVGAGLSGRFRRSSPSEEQQLTDRGDSLLRDAAPLQAGVALPPLRKAVELDPGNTRALGLLALAAETSANNGGSLDPASDLRAAEASARAALAKDPQEPHAKLALLDMSGASLDWLQWERELQSLHTAVPENVHVLGSLSSFLQAAGDTPRSWVFNEQAAAAAPSSPTPQWRRALRLWTGGRTVEALRLTERLLPLWPTHPLVWNARFMILAFSGRTAAAAALMNDPAAPTRNSHPARPQQWLPTLDAFADPTAARIAKARDANLAAARQNPAQAAYAAMALSQLGEIDAAFMVMDALLLAKGPLVTARPISSHAFAANSPSWCRTQWLFMPPLAAARADPRFATLCDEIGLARYWRARGAGPNTSLPGQLTLS